MHEHQLQYSVVCEPQVLSLHARNGEKANNKSSILKDSNKEGM